MKRWIVPCAGLMMAAAVAVPALAQSQPSTTPAQPDGRGGAAALLMCSTTNVTDTVATALGMSAADLRLALVSGKTVSQLATSKNVELQTIEDALVSARQSDLDQALKDGLLTQDQYDRITMALKNVPSVNGNGRFEIRVPAFNVVNREQAAADALGISCADLVKAQQSGQGIAQVAQDKGVDVQTVIDGVTNAYKTALAEDVKEGLITQAQSDGRLSHLTIEIGQWVYDERGGFGFGGPGRPGEGGQNGFGGPGRPGNGGQDGQNGFGGPGRGGQNGQGGPNGINPPSGFNAPNAPTAPEATPTVNT